MTKAPGRRLVVGATRALVVLATLLALAAPAQAHGAPAAREIDTRVLLDDDGLVAYGGCLEGECATPAEGLDLLALDVREAVLEGEPAVVFRVVVQSEVVHDSRTVVLSVTAAGATKEFIADNGDGTVYTSTTFDAIQGPFDVGDGHPKAFDGWVKFTTLGIDTGAELTGITVHSKHHDATDDAMPGGWFLEGQELPHLPHEPDPDEVLAEHDPGAYTLRGPASLLGLEANVSLADLGAGPVNLTVRVTNPVASLPQFVTVGMAFGEGIVAAVSSPTLNLDAGGARDLQVAVSEASRDGTLRLTLSSDLGAHATLEVAVKGRQVTVSNETTGPALANDAGPKESPSLPLAMLLAGLAAFTIVRRNRSL